MALRWWKATLQSVRAWVRHRRARRAAERAAALAHARATAFGVLEGVIDPFVRAGEATVSRSEDSANVEPRNPRAAAIWLEPDPAYHSLGVGPHGNLHEIFDDAELELCLRAIVDGRYSEDVAADGQRLIMRFHLPDATEIRVMHFGAPGMTYGEPGLRRYPAYSDGAQSTRGDVVPGKGEDLGAA
jgi:hypothetical protein